MTRGSRPEQPQGRRSLMERLRLLRQDVRGVGAVEFALIAPLLLSLYITSFELTIGLSMSKRVTRTASTIADLVTQQQTSVTTDYLGTMVGVTNAIFTPYSPQNLVMKITGVAVDSAGNATAAWSWDKTGGKPYNAGSSVTVPSDMRTPDTFLVRAEVSVTHQLFMFMPGIMPDRLQTITMSREFFYRVRVGSKLDCTGCKA